MLGRLAAGQGGNDAEGLAVVASLERLLGIGDAVHGELPIGRLVDGETDGSDGLWGGELKLNPGRRARLRNGKPEGIRAGAGGERGGIHRASRGGDRRAQRRGREVRGGAAEGDHGGVGVKVGPGAGGAGGLMPPLERQVLERPGDGGRARQHSVEGLAARDGRLAPDIFLHTLGGWDPGAAGFAPAGRAGDGHLEAEFVGKRGGVFEGVLPFRRHVGEALVDDLRRIEGGVEDLDAAEADAMHPFEVKPDTLLGDVAVHPVPPDARAGTRRGRLKAAAQGIRGGLGGGDGGKRECAQEREQEHRGQAK